jgi:hypothetical protein
LAPLPVRVADVNATYASTGPSGGQVMYSALIETTDLLYRRLDPTEYLRAHAPAELAAIEAASALLSGPYGGRVAARTSAAGRGDDPNIFASGTPSAAPPQPNIQHPTLNVEVLNGKHSEPNFEGGGSVHWPSHSRRESCFFGAILRDRTTKFSFRFSR